MTHARQSRTPPRHRPIGPPPRETAVSTDPASTLTDNAGLHRDGRRPRGRNTRERAQTPHTCRTTPTRPPTTAKRAPADTEARPAPSRPAHHAEPKRTHEYNTTDRTAPAAPRTRSAYNTMPKASPAPQPDTHDRSARHVDKAGTVTLRHNAIYTTSASAEPTRNLRHPARPGPPHQGRQRHHRRAPPRPDPQPQHQLPAHRSTQGTHPEITKSRTQLQVRLLPMS